MCYSDKALKSGSTFDLPRIITNNETVTGNAVVDFEACVSPLIGQNSPLEDT